MKRIVCAFVFNSSIYHGVEGFWAACLSANGGGFGAKDVGVLN